MEMEKIIEKITQYRNRKGYTYENMADELELTTAAYRKIETGETKLSVERPKSTTLIPNPCKVAVTKEFTIEPEILASRPTTSVRSFLFLLF